MTIEELSTENVKHLVELVLELWEGCDFDEEYEAYKKIIDSENEICFLVKIQESYIAFIHLNIRNDYVEGSETLPITYIEGLYVKPHHQKQGIARKLVESAEKWARQKGYKQLASDTDFNNYASIDFHKKIGFSEVQRIVCFIKEL